MNKNKTIILVIFVVIAALIIIYSSRPMFSFDRDDDLDCRVNGTNSDKISFCRIYSLRILVNDNGIHFLSTDQFNVIKKNITTIKENEDNKPINKKDYKCSGLDNEYLFYNLDGKTYLRTNLYDPNSEIDALYDLCMER